MKKIKLHLLIIVLFSFSSSLAQDIAKPSKGKSLVYFVRYAGTGALINFKYFDGEKYLGKFNGVNYLIYECDPGEHVFWVTAENRSFIQADLQADETYLVEVRPQMGAVKARVLVKPITEDKRKQKAFKLITRKNSIELDKAKVDEEAKSLDFYIENGMDKYKRDLEKGVSFEKLTIPTSKE